MSESLQKIIAVLDKKAPKKLAESWDNIGLQIGSFSQKIDKIMTVLDITEENVLEAIEKKVNLIVTHHPLILKPLMHIRKDLAQEKLIYELIKNEIAVFVLHTNIDIALDGLNDALAAKLALNTVEILKVTQAEDLFKVAVFVPSTHATLVYETMMAKGAGNIGNYSHCSFQVNGTGTFLPLDTTQPFLGAKNLLTKVEETKIETIVSATNLKNVIASMIKVHPYEEVAYDIYKLENKFNEVGLGRKGVLENEILLIDFVKILKEKLKQKIVSVVGELDKKVKKIAVCGGAGASLIYDAYFAGVDVLVTGDIKYHDAQIAKSLGLSLVDAGHFGTEVHIAEHLASFLQECTVRENWKVKKENIFIGKNTETFNYV